MVMTTLADVLDPHALRRALTSGHVRAQAHPELPYTILNYTERAAYDVAWNDVTLSCRGLIYDHSTDVVLARPFRKFFNYGQLFSHGQSSGPILDLDSAAVVTDKADGSLGILYPTPDDWAIATRGSFTSDQAVHATEVLRSRYATFEPPPGLTVLVEIVYPGNRIVLNYGDLDDLILLGAVDIATGRSFDPGVLMGWPGPVTEVFSYATLAQALVAPPRPNAEGLVVHLSHSDNRVKFKQEDYVALHRIVTGLNARTVWRHVVSGEPLGELITPLPDEFHPWVRAVTAELTARVERQRAELVRAYDDVLWELSQLTKTAEDWTRKDFALHVASHPHRWAMFMLLDRRDICPTLWQRAQPEASWTPSGRTYSEDTA
jgi:RNA ligase